MAQNHLEEMAFSHQEAFQRLSSQEEAVRNQQTPSTRNILGVEEDMVHLQQRFGIQDCFEHLPELSTEALERNQQCGRRKNNNHVAYDSMENPYIYYDSDSGQPDPLQNSNMTTSATQTSESLEDRPDCQSRDPEQNRNSSLSSSMCCGEWPTNRVLWISGPCCIGEKDSLSGLVNQDTSTVMSFSSSAPTMGSRHSHSHQLGTKVEMVYSLLSMLGTHDKEDMSRTLLAMSSNQDCCIAMRQSGCLPLLVQLLHGGDRDTLLSSQDPHAFRWVVREARRRASQALHNIVHAHPDDKRGRREARVLRLLEQIRDYCDYLRDVEAGLVEDTPDANVDHHPGPAIAALMKLSFDEEHRHAMCQLGGLQAIAELIQADHDVHGNTSDQYCVTMRRYAGMALTNLTFGDGTNKALLCSMKSFMRSLVAQLHSPSEDLRQVTASVLRNLSWRADSSSKQTLREVGAVTTLMKAAMEAPKESTLKSILSALWNLSAHCSMNKADICAVDGALAFLVGTLTYKSPLKTLSIVENGGGILRNISSHIAVREDYRVIMRKHKCLQTLLRHLKSPSLTVVSNACGTLWNLSARCAEDQKALWEMGAVGMLRNLVHSKHKMIAMGSSAALKNLLAAKPTGIMMELNGFHENAQQRSVNSNRNNLPCLHVRKQRALEAEIDQNLSETCDNIDSPKTSPTRQSGAENRFVFGNLSTFQRPQCMPYLPGRMYHSINGHLTSPPYVSRSDSRDSIGSTHSEPPHYCGHRETFRIFSKTRFLSLDRKALYGRPTELRPPGPLFRQNDACTSSDPSSVYQSEGDNLPRAYPCERKSDSSIRGSSNKVQTKLTNLSSQQKKRWEGFLKSQDASDSLTNGINGAHFSGSADSESQSSMANSHFLNPNVSHTSYQYNPAPIFQNLLYEMNDLQEEPNMKRQDYRDEGIRNGYSHQVEGQSSKMPAVSDSRYATTDKGMVYAVEENVHSFQQQSLQSANIHNSIEEPESSFHSLASSIVGEVDTKVCDESDYSYKYTAESNDRDWTSQNLREHPTTLDSQHMYHQDRISHKYGMVRTSAEVRNSAEGGFFLKPNSMDLLDEAKKPLFSQGSSNFNHSDEAVISRMSDTHPFEEFPDALKPIHQSTNIGGALPHSTPSILSLANGPIFHPSHPEEECGMFSQDENIHGNNLNIGWTPISTFSEEEQEKCHMSHRHGQEEYTDGQQEAAPPSGSVSSGGAQISDKDSEPSTESSCDFDQDSIDPPVSKEESHPDSTDNNRLLSETEILNANSSNALERNIPVKSLDGCNQITSPLPINCTGTTKVNNTNEGVFGIYRTEGHATLPQDINFSSNNVAQGLSDANSFSDENDNLAQHILSVRNKTTSGQNSFADQLDTKEASQTPMSPTTFKSKLPLLAIRKTKDAQLSREEEHTHFHLVPPGLAKNSVIPKETPPFSSLCGISQNWQKSSNRGSISSNKIAVEMSTKRKIDGHPTTEEPEGVDSTYSSSLPPSIPQEYSNNLDASAHKGELRTFSDWRSRLDSKSCTGNNTSSLQISHPKELNSQFVQHHSLPDLSACKIQTPHNKTGQPHWHLSQKPTPMLPVSLQSRTDTVRNEPSFSFSGTGTLNFFGVESGDESLACDQSLLEECAVSGMTKESTDSEDMESKFINRKAEGDWLSTVSLPAESSCQIDNKDTELHRGYSSRHLRRADHEEKGKEDEHTQEKIDYQTPPLNNGSKAPFFLCEPNGTDFNEHSNRNLFPRTSHLFQNKIMPPAIRSDGIHDVQSRTENSPTKSDEICYEAEKIAERVLVEVEDLTDDVTHSSVSCLSDLDNIKPPSAMGDVMSLSMTSSGLSDVPSLSKNGECGSISERNCVDKRWNIKRSKKGNGSHRYVPEALRRALNATLDAVKSSDNQENGHCSGSVENLSMKSSGTSEVLDNINPPSIMDEISMTNSCASLSSISSDILESRSHSLADGPNLRSSSEMFERLNAAAAMVQVYSRELNNIMTGSMKSSCNSDTIDHVKPPSVFQDIAEVTVEDGTEVGSDTLASDAELEEELPHDDEGSLPSSDTIHLQHHFSLMQENLAEGSTENLTSTLDTESDYKEGKKIKQGKASEQAKSFSTCTGALISSHSDLKPVNLGDATTKTGNESAMIEEETMSLVSNESEGDNFKTGRIETLPLQPVVSRGPRIVKPVTRETIRQMQEKKSLEKGIRSIRGRGASSVRGTTSRARSEPIKTKENTLISVRPTRTSALRATHNQKSTGTRPPESILSKPPVKRISVARMGRTSRTSSSAKDSTSQNSSSETQDCSVKTSLNRSIETKENIDNSQEEHPKLLTKQGTFTKEKPTQNVPQISPDSSNKTYPLDDDNTAQNVGSGIVKSQSDHSVSQQPGDKLDRNNRMLRSTGSSVGSKGTTRRPSSSSAAVSRSGSNYSIRRNYSGPIFRRKASRSSLINSPSSCSVSQQDGSGSKLIDAKRSPSSVSLNGHSASAPSSQTVSQMSLSSMSSSGISLKRSSSYRVKKEVPSKIAFLWKKSESSSSANSPVADTPGSDPGASPPSRSKGHNEIGSSKVKSPTTDSLPEGLKHSSTYEKLPKDSGQNDAQVNQWAASLRSSRSSISTEGSSKNTSHQGARSTWSRPSGTWRRKKARDGDSTSAPTKTVTGENKTASFPPSKSLSKSTPTTRSRDGSLQATPAQMSKSRTFTARNRRVVSPATTETISVWGGTTPTRKQSPTGALEKETSKVSDSKGTRSPISGQLDLRPSHASAVVSPFNYTPSAVKKKEENEGSSSVVVKSAGAQRRNSYINSMQPEEEEQERQNGEDEDEEQDSESGTSGEKKACMVTMV